jgi:hypothetical protein
MCVRFPSAVTMNSNANAGLAVTSHDITQLNTSTFDNVAVNAGTTGPPPISFSTKSLNVSGASSGAGFGIPNFTGPTSVMSAPTDGSTVARHRQIFIATMDRATLSDPAARSVTSVQEIDDIYQKQSTICNQGGNINNCAPGPNPGQGRQITGFTFGNDSTATHIADVSHSGLGSASIDPALDQRGGVITRLILEPNTATPDPNDLSVISDKDLVVGIPRSIEAHAEWDVDWPRRLAVPRTAATPTPDSAATSSATSTRYLSATVASQPRQPRQTLPIDVSHVNAAADMTPLANKFEMYATGYRNGYDLVWHSNGKLYLNGNAANRSQGNTPGTTDGCSTPSISPGDEQDQLNIVTHGAYAGHPNPTRHECVWHDGSVYSPPLSPEPTYVPPIWHYVNLPYVHPDEAGKHDDKFAEILGPSSTYAGDQNVKRVVLSNDGLSVVQVVNLAQFNRPLDVTTETSD